MDASVEQYTYPFPDAQTKPEDPAFQYITEQALSKHLQEAAGRGPVVEVGGFTAEGYASMRSVTFAKPCIIANLPLSESVHCASPLKPTDESQSERAYFVYADGRRLPFAANSLGVVLMCALPPLTVEASTKANEAARKPSTPIAQLACATIHYFALADTIRRTGEDSDQSITEQSPLLGSMLEAKRTLAEGGALVMRRGLSIRELKVAEALGFNLIAATPAFNSTYYCGPDGHSHYREGPLEMVLQKGSSARQS